MTAFFVATSRIKDAEKFAEYGAGVGPTLAPFGGELVLRGKAVETLAGSSDHHAVGILRFASMDDLVGWYRSDAYQALVALRDAAVTAATLAGVVARKD